MRVGSAVATSPWVPALKLPLSARFLSVMAALWRWFDLRSLGVASAEGHPLACVWSHDSGRGRGEEVAVRVRQSGLPSLRWRAAQFGWLTAGLATVAIGLLTVAAARLSKKGSGLDLG